MRFRPLLAAVLFSLANVPALAQSQTAFDSSTYPASAPQDFDYGNFTYSFADVGAIQSAGSVDYPGVGQISWTPGTRPEDIFTVGMFTNTFAFQNLTIDQISQTIGQPISEASLASFPLVQNLTVPQLAQAIPGLAQTPLSDAAPIATIALAQGVFGDTVGDIASQVQGPIGQLGNELTKYSITQIPGLSSTSLSQLPGINAAKISDIPGLEQFPLVNPLSILDWFVPFDIPFGMSECNLGSDCHERNIDNTASGNMQNMSIPCTGEQQSCAHIEVRRNGLNPTDKIRWISKEQKVTGGSGLGSNICNEEPTGRFPLGPNPKVVLEKIEEQPGQVEFALYFSVHVDLDESDSAHCFGPFPMPFFNRVQEGQWILFGPDTVPKNSPFASMGGGGPGGGAGGAGGGEYACVASDGKATVAYKGVDIAAFKNAITNVESRSSGLYKAVGIFVNDGQGNVGRALGKYQFMSYGPAKDIIGAKPGGAQFLAAMANPNIDASSYAAQVDQLFTPAEQEALMDTQIRHLADLGTAKGLSGDALIKRMAEMHEGGDGAGVDKDKVYTSSVVADYKKGGCVAGSGLATGTLSYPVHAPITEGYLTDTNNWRGRVHLAIDFGASMDTPIHAADGGVVSFAGWGGACGNMVIVDHKNGFTTTYCHMNKINTVAGTPVSSGQVIGFVGSTGRSTGPHLHFALKKNGVPVNPLLYLKGN